MGHGLLNLSHQSPVQSKILSIAAATKVAMARQRVALRRPATMGAGMLAIQYTETPNSNPKEGQLSGHKVLSLRNMAFGHVNRLHKPSFI